MAEGQFAPYAPPENMARVFARVRSNGWPGRVDLTYLDALGLSEGNIPRVLQALKFLGVIDDDGTPTDLAETLHHASEDEYPVVLLDGLRTAYRDIFRVVNPENASRQMVRDAFRPMKPAGQQDRMTTLFLGLCKLAGVQVQDPPTQRPGQGASRKPVPVTKRAGNAGKTTGGPQGFSASTFRPTYLAGRDLHPAIAGILQAVPELETADELERWIESFRATFLMVKEVQKAKDTQKK